MFYFLYPYKFIYCKSLSKFIYDWTRIMPELFSLNIWARSAKLHDLELNRQKQISRIPYKKSLGWYMILAWCPNRCQHSSWWATKYTKRFGGYARCIALVQDNIKRAQDRAHFMLNSINNHVYFSLVRKCFTLSQRYAHVSEIWVGPLGLWTGEDGWLEGL